ncbi:MAG: TonB-dependent receptor [Sphingopyxis sp.]|uniref:TonB-dependent receptor plug domain-containing protein n=1 Tax=Sphingopyxis sp. TaxID=1908224 RepID=UPI002AB9A52B|nr:TonB-dependent receptor [Sphingopyxis sp.]MDZ3832325.1 TonB-dependent receptor [Sphingopyxis sp.]
MKRMTACALVALQFVAPSVAMAADAVSADVGADFADADGDLIIVTGTRDARRTQFDTLAPIDILPSKAIDSSVSDDLSDTLAQLLPSFNVQRLPAADGLAFVRPATLRGLSPDQTLVLVNGKRYHRSALPGTRGAQAADLASIPNLAIKRIEVLRDGASAQYGSDAIAGVINIILDDQPGMEAFGQFSQYYEGDGKAYRTGGQGGVRLGDRGALVFSGEFTKSDATSRTRQRADAEAFQAANPGLNIPNPVQRWGQPDLRSVRASVNADYEIADGATLYAFGTIADGEGVTDFNWRNPANTANVYKPSPAFPGFSFTDLYPAGFTPRFGTEYDDYQIVGGLRGEASDAFSYDFSASVGRNRIDYTMQESLNASMGPDSPTSFYLGRLRQREVNLNADFVYRLPLGLADPANIAFGAERRKESYAIYPGDPASYAIGPGAASGLAPNSNGFPGFSPLNAGEWSQTSYAGYLDVEVSPAEMLTLGAAGRYEDFSAFGDTFNYKLSARLEPVSGVAVRATYSTGFRAPTPGQLNAVNTTQGLDTTTLQIFNRGRLSPSDPLAIALGAQPLKPEKSRTLTAGLTFQSDFGLTGSIDVYQIKLRDRFGQSRTFTVPDTFPNPQRFTAVNYFTNDFDTRTRGIDVVLAYARDIGAGRADVNLAYNYNRTKVTSGITDAIGNATQRVLFEDRLPKHNATASLGYTIGGFGLQARARYYGAWTDVSGNATGEVFQRFGSMVLFDLSASLKLSEHVTIRAGAENLFDSYPDEATNQAVRGLIYSRNAPYDTDGGQYYVRLGINF